MPGFFLIDGAAHAAALRPGQKVDMSGATVVADGGHIWIHLDGQAHQLTWQDAITHYEEEAGGHADDIARAPMPGSVIQVAVNAGDAVVAGDMMMIIESMKLETVIKAPRDGVIEAVHLAVGQTFERDAALVSLEALAA